MIKVTGLMIERLAEDKIKSLFEKTMPINITYTISRAIAKMKDESKAYLELRQKLIMKHSVKGEKPDKEGNIRVKNFELFAKDLMELQSQEIELGIKKIKAKLSDLPDLSIAEMEFIFPFIDLQDADVIDIDKKRKK